MFDDDYFDEEESPKDELLYQYTRIRDGETTPMLSEDEFEWVITHYALETQYDEALLAAEIAQVYHPFSATILFLKAEILSRAQKYGQALLALDQLETMDQYHLDATLLRAEILSHQEKPEMAAQWLEEQIPQFTGKDQIQLMLELVDTYDEAEQFDNVWKMLKQVLILSPSNEEALHKVSFWAEFTDNHEESIAIHKAIVNEDPYNALAWFNLGAALHGKKLYEAAIDAYEYCLAIDDKFEVAYRNIAEAFIRLRWYEQALEALEAHLNFSRPEDVIFEAMGFCWEKKKDYNKARYYYRRASQLNPHDDAIFSRIGETYVRQQQWEKAAKSFEAALQLKEDHAPYYVSLGNCLLELNQEEDAIHAFAFAVSQRSSSKKYWVALIRGLYLTGNYQEAFDNIQLAAHYTLEQPEYKYLMAAVLIEMGKTKEAMFHLEEGLADKPQRVKVFTELNPDYMRRPQVVELIGRYKNKNKKKNTRSRKKS